MNDRKRSARVTHVYMQVAYRRAIPARNGGSANSNEGVRA